MPEQRIGVVIHYWGKIGVAGVKITEGELRVGDTIHVMASACQKERRKLGTITQIRQAEMAGLHT